MEELTLEDLAFDNDESAGLFNKDKADNTKIEDLGDDTDIPKKNNSVGEDLDDPESVATGDNKTQVQGGKTSKGNKEGSDSSSPKPNDTEQLYSNLAAQFKAKGVLPGLEDTKEIKSLEDLNAALLAEVENRLTSTQKTIKEAADNGLDAGEVSKQLQVIEKLKSVSDDYIADEDNLEFRKRVISQDFISRGYSKERADILSQRSIDSGQDIEDAKLALSSVIQIEEKKIADAIKSAKDEEKKSINNIKDFLHTNEEVIPGIKLTTEQRNKIYDQMTTDLGNKENAFMKAQKAEPIRSRVVLETIFFVTKGFKDFSIFGNAKESEVTKNIENLLRGADFTETGRVNTDVPDDNGTFTLADLKNLEIE